VVECRVGLGSLVVRENREWRDKNFAGKTEKRIFDFDFWPKTSIFRAGWESLVVRESGDRRDRIFDKKSEKEKTMACIF